MSLSKIGSLAFLPQAYLVIYLAFKYYRDLSFCWFVSTFAFVTFNQVCTSQYLVWYIVFLLIVYRIRFAHLNDNERSSTSLFVVVRQPRLVALLRLPFLMGSMLCLVITFMESYIIVYFLYHIIQHSPGFMGFGKSPPFPPLLSARSCWSVLLASSVKKKKVIVEDTEGSSVTKEDVMIQKIDPEDDPEIEEA